jgi:hypothetical protein
VRRVGKKKPAFRKAKPAQSDAPEGAIVRAARYFFRVQRNEYPLAKDRREYPG